MSAQGQHVPLRLFNGLLAMGPKATRILEARENLSKFDDGAWLGPETSETIERNNVPSWSVLMEKSHRATVPQVLLPSLLLGHP